TAALTQRRGRVDVELEATSLPSNHHAVVAPSGLERHIPGSHIGEHALRDTLQRVAESPAAAHLADEPFSLLKPERIDLARRKSLNHTIGANHADAVGQSIFPPEQAPRRTDSPLDSRLVHGRIEHSDLRAQAQAAAPFACTAGVLPQ